MAINRIAEHLDEMPKVEITTFNDIEQFLRSVLSQHTDAEVITTAVRLVKNGEGMAAFAHFYELHCRSMERVE